MEEMARRRRARQRHWVADRQSGPLLLRFGTEENDSAFCAIVRGELAFRSAHERAGLGSDSRRSAPGDEDRRAAIWSTAPRWDVERALSDCAISLFRTQVVPDRSTRSHAFLVDLRSTKAHHPADHRPRRQAPLQRGQLHDAFVPDEARVGNDRRRLESR